MPIIAVVAGVVAVIGIALTYMTFEKAEVIIDNPVIEIAVVVGALLVLVLIVRYLKGAKGT